MYRDQNFSIAICIDIYTYKIIYIHMAWLYIHITNKLIPVPPEKGLSDIRCTFDKNLLFSCRDNSCCLVLFNTLPIFIHKRA